MAAGKGGDVHIGFAQVSRDFVKLVLNERSGQSGV